VREAIGVAIEIDEKGLHARALSASRSGRLAVGRLPLPSFASRFM